jgi:DNA-binding transcriptional LysR family regulator
MRQSNFNDLQAFLVVARVGSFTKAAGELGISQSALSQTIRGLEARLGLRLLTRTTRSVAGERLLTNIGPRFEEVEAELAALSELRDKPAGHVRLSMAEHAAITVVWPKLEKVLPQYPEVKVEINIDYGFTDIVAQRFDAGVRLGEALAKDMIAVRIAPDLRMAVVGAPAYFAKRPPPSMPQELAAHDCINLRLPTLSGLYAWEFEKDGHELRVHVEGQLTFNSSTPRVRAALAGCGLAFVPEDMVAAHVARGELLRVLEDWCPSYTGYHLYFPERRQASPAFRVVVDALRYRP